MADQNKDIAMQSQDHEDDQMLNELVEVFKKEENQEREEQKHHEDDDVKTQLNRYKADAIKGKWRILNSRQRFEYPWHC